MFVRILFIIGINVMFNIQCSTTKQLGKIVDEMFSEQSSSSFSENKDYLLVQGKLKTSVHEFRIDFVVFELKSKEVVYKRAGIIGSVKWQDDYVLYICDSPAVPNDDKNTCYLYDVKSSKKL